MPSDADDREMFVCKLMEDELDALRDGETILFNYEGAVIEQDSMIAVEVCDGE